MSGHWRDTNPLLNSVKFLGIKTIEKIGACHGIISVLQSIFEARLEAFWARNTMKRIWEAIFSKKRMPHERSSLQFAPRIVLFSEVYASLPYQHYKCQIKKIKPLFCKVWLVSFVIISIVYPQLSKALSSMSVNGKLYSILLAMWLLNDHVVFNWPGSLH